MEETVSAADANREFSRLLRGVREGRSYVVTTHGKPVAKIVPVDEESEKIKRMRARAHKTLMARLRAKKPIDIGRWTRDELYEDV